MRNMAAAIAGITEFRRGLDPEQMTGESGIGDVHLRRLDEPLA
jgi:hypothetical protein